MKTIITGTAFRSINSIDFDSTQDSPLNFLVFSLIASVHSYAQQASRGQNLNLMMVKIDCMCGFHKLLPVHEAIML